ICKMKHFIEDIKEQLIKYYGGNDFYEDDDGNLFIGFFSESEEYGIKNYLHTFYAGLNEKQIDDLEKLIERKLPQELGLFYKETNGCVLFRSLNLHGYIGKGVGLQPISLTYGTIRDRPMKDGEFTDNSNEIRFGGYGIDHYDVMRYLDKDVIYAVQRFAPEPVYFEWKNLSLFWEMIRFLLHHNRSIKNPSSGTVNAPPC
ncbi:MAG: hypothetical protein P8Y65_07825, partial [Campylobacterales bacterium]